METPHTHIPTWTTGDRFRKARTDAGLTREDIVNLTGLSMRTVVNYETGQTHPRRIGLIAWARATGVPEWWLEGTYPHQPKTVSSTWYLLKFPMQNQNVQNETLRAVA